MASVNGGFHHRDTGVWQPMFHIEYMRDAWTGQRETFLNALPGNHSYAAVLPGTSSAHHMHMFQPPDLVNHETMDQVKEAGVVEKENVPNKKRQRPKALKSPKVKKDMRGPRAPKPEGSPFCSTSKVCQENCRNYDKWDQYRHFSHSYTGFFVYGTPTMLSLGLWWVAIGMLYDLHIYVSLAYEYKKAWFEDSREKKMSLGAFKVVLEKLAGEGYDFLIHRFENSLG